MDFTIPITGGTVTIAIGTVIWYFARERITEARNKRNAVESLLTSHIALCNEKAVGQVRLEGQVERICERVDELREAAVKHEERFDRMYEKIDNLTEVIVAKRTI